MTGAAYQFQLALYDALANDSAISAEVVGVYDNPTQISDPSDNSEFPFITMSDILLNPWDDDTDKGHQVTATIHVWSRASHALEARKIQGLIYDRLHRGTLSITGYRFVGMDEEDQDVQRDEDGITRHGIQNYRITFLEE